jgi:homoserine trans-succinylase
MQRIIPESRLHAVQTSLLKEIKATKKRINPVHHPLFNLTMQNKIDHANQILRLMNRYPNMTVEELFYLIACRIEGEKFVVSSYRWSVPMLQETYDNRDNLERLQYLVWDAGGKVQWED